MASELTRATTLALERATDSPGRACAAAQPEFSPWAEGPRSRTADRQVARVDRPSYPVEGAR